MKVSVNIVTKNRAELLKVALASVEAQTFKDFEVVLVDDGSTDNTAQVVESFRATLPKLVLYKFPRSVGVVAARRKALELSEGEPIAVLDDDDTWTSAEKLSKQVECFEQQAQMVLVGCRGEMSDFVTGKVNAWQPPSTDTEIRKHMLLRNCFLNPAVMFKREAALLAGAYGSDTPDAEDYALALALGIRGKMYILPENLMCFRVNHNGLTLRNNTKQIRAGIKLIVKYRRDYPGFYTAIFKWFAHLIFVNVFGPVAWSRFRNRMGRYVWKTT